MKQKTFHAWGIDINEEPYGLVGRYWIFNGYVKIPQHMIGSKFALFETRHMARKNLSYVKRVFSKAKVVKVSVTLEWE